MTSPAVIGPLSDFGSLDPEGFRSLLNYLWKVGSCQVLRGITLNHALQRYKLPIYVTENGFAVKNETYLPLEKALQDDDRVAYFKGATDSLVAAVFEDGVDVRSYFAWSQSINPVLLVSLANADDRLP